jgi:hypothetical protein
MDGRDGEIVGILHVTNGHSCVTHVCCGKHMRVGDLIPFWFTVEDIGGDCQDALAAVCIFDGTETLFIVGFLLRHIVVLYMDDFVGRFAQILELYEGSEDQLKRQKTKILVSLHFECYITFNNKSNLAKKTCCLSMSYYDL